jgi:hypothetical protein
MSVQFLPGDLVVYRKQKSSVHPGQHAQNILPAPHGDSYSYTVEKYWRVIDVQRDHSLVVRTRTGKLHTILANDPNLRRAHWWERLLFWHRFPARTSGESAIGKDSTFLLRRASRDRQ